MKLEAIAGVSAAAARSRNPERSRGTFEIPAAAMAMKPKQAGLRTYSSVVPSTERGFSKKVAFVASKKIADDFGTDYGGNGKIQIVCNGTGVSRV